MCTVNKQLFDFCKDHYKNFGCFPTEFEDSQGNILYYPDYLSILSDVQYRMIAYHCVDEE